VLRLGVSVRATVKVRFRVYLLRLVCFYQAYCTLVVCYCYMTGGVLISRCTGVSVATALKIDLNLLKMMPIMHITLIFRQCLFCCQDGSSKRHGRKEVNTTKR